MSIPTSLDRLQVLSYKESTVTVGQPGIVVVNSDGSAISAGGGGGAATIADGADVTQGALADAVVAAGATGSLSAKLRRLTTDLDALNAKVTAVNTGAVVLAAGAATIGALTANQTINNAQIGGVTISTGAGVVGTGVQRVTHASDDPVTTSVQLIDDAIFTDDAAFTPATSKGMMIMAQADETSSDSVDEGDAGALRMTLTRFLKTSAGDLQAGEDLTNNVTAMVMKPVSVSTYALTFDDSAALEASSVSKASAGNLYIVTGWNNNAAVRYFHVYNSTTVPADGTVPIICIPVAAGGTFSISYQPFGKPFTTGMSWANSTTAATKTVGGADFWVNLGYT